MDKDNRKYRFCFIDYMWYVAENGASESITISMGECCFSYAGCLP